MAGVLNYQNFINIFTTSEDVQQIFPRDQHRLTYDFDDLGADGWTAEVSWMTLVIDYIKYTTDQIVDFSNSNVIGYFDDLGSNVQYDATTVVLPSDMYTGPLLPGAERNVPVTIANIKWTRDTEVFQRQLLLVQNWEPGTEIGDPTKSPFFLAIVESFPVSISFILSTSTAQVSNSVGITTTGTSNRAVPISNDFDINLTPPSYFQFSNQTTIFSGKLDNGLSTGTFVVDSRYVDQVLVPSSNYNVTTSTLTSTTGTVYGRIANTSSVFTITADVSREHQLRLDWYFDGATGYRGGRTGSQTILVSTTQNYVYVGQPLELTIAQNSQFQRLNQTSTFVVSHNINSSTTITGLVSLFADYTPANTTSTSVVTIGTGTFNVSGDAAISAILNSGTYVLQASYAGNMGVDIFHPMYLSTWTNTLTHYVQLGRELALTELLIEENTNTDVLYVHAIDDGLWESTITGQVTFFNNDIAIGTSTFSRYSYQILDTDNVQEFKIPTPGNYPYADNIRTNLTRLPGENTGLYPTPYPVGDVKMWSYYNYNWDNAAAPSYYATLRYNTKELDWPPTQTPINTIALQNTEDPTHEAVLPFTITLPEANHPVFVSTSLDQNGNPTTDPNPQTRLTCVEYLGTATYTYPSVTFTSKVDYRSLTQYTATSDQLPVRYAVGNTVYISVAPAGPHGFIRGRYAAFAGDRNTIRPAGTRYHWIPGSYVQNGVVTNFTFDLGDEPPYQFTVAGTSSGICQVFRFAEEIPSPTFINFDNSDSHQSILGAKAWRNYPDSATYNRFTAGVTSSKFNQLDNDAVGYYADQRHNVPVEQINLTVKSRSHIAKITLAKNIIDSTGTFRASFSGDIAATGVGFYPEEIAFLDQGSTAISVSTDNNVSTKLGGGFDPRIPGNEWIQTISTDMSWEIQNPAITRVQTSYYPTVPITYDYSEADPNPYRNYTPGPLTIYRSWQPNQGGQFITFSNGTFIGPTYRYINNFGNYNPILSNDMTAIVPNIRITTSATTTATLSYPNILTPQRNIGDQRNIPQDYTKNIGWLNRRTPSGNVTVVNTSTGQVIATRSLSEIPSVPLVVRNRSESGVYVETLKYINLPEVVRPDLYSSTAWTTDTKKYTRLDILTTSSLTTSSTATIVVPMVSLYTGTTKLSATTSTAVTLRMSGAQHIVRLASTSTTWPAVPSTANVLLHSGVYSLSDGYLWLCSDQKIVFPPLDPLNGFETWPTGATGDGSKWQFFIRYEQWTENGASLIKSTTVTPISNEPTTQYGSFVWPGAGGQFSTEWNQPNQFAPPLAGFRLDDTGDTANYLFKIYFVFQGKPGNPTPRVKDGAEVEYSFRSITLRTTSDRLAGTVLYSGSY